MLKPLIVKDMCVNRLPLLAGLAFFIAPYALSSVAVVNMPLWTEATPASAWAVLIATGSYFSIMCSQPTLVMVAGNSIAAERIDRSAEFLAYLPPSKAQILSSKVLVFVGTGLAIWGLNLVARFVAEWLGGSATDADMLVGDLPYLSRLLIVGGAAAGASWCASSMLESSGMATALGFITPMIVFAALMLTWYVMDWTDMQRFVRVYFTTCATAGVLLFSVGCVYFLRRVEP